MDPDEELQALVGQITRLASKASPAVLEVAAAQLSGLPFAPHVPVFLHKVGYAGVDSLRDREMLSWGSMGVTAADCSVIAHLLTSGALSQLKRLFLFQNPLGDVGLASLMDGLARSKVQLATLALSSCEITDDGLGALTTVMASGAMTELRSLRLSGNQVGDAGLAAIAEASAMGSMRNLREVLLNGNQIGDAGVVALAGVITQGGLSSLKILGLMENQVGDVGMSALAGALMSGGMPVLEEAWLWSNRIGDEGMRALASTVASGTLARCKLIGVPVRHSNPQTETLAQQLL